MKRIIIIGLGDVARYVISGISKSLMFQIVGLCDIDKDRLDKVNVSSAQVFTDYKEMIRLIEYDYVLLLIHHSNRIDILLDLIENGCSVICEKPLACSINEMNKLLKTCEENNNYPIVMYHRSYNKGIDTLFKLLDTKRVKKIEIYYLEDIAKQTTKDDYKYLTDRQGGGCVQDNLPNCIHYLFLYGEVSLVEYKIVSDNMTYSSSASINLLLNSEIECDIFLDWHSNIDNKSIVVYMDKSHVTINLQQGYVVPKNSLIDEYASFFTNMSSYDFRRLREVDIKIVNIINEINN